jgi:membrane fusion protein (multidrug efflux system)
MRHTRWFLSSGLLALAASACEKPAATRPLPDVSVMTVAPEDVPARLQYVGQVEALRHVEVRSQVTGIIQEQAYTDGTDVAAGALLFRLEATSYRASYEAAMARLRDAEARAANAERLLGRLQPLLAERAVSQKDVDDAATELARAQADVAARRADADKAKKDLDDTEIRAEIAGRADRAILPLGARVTGPADLLTTIDQIDRVYVNFNPSDQDILRWRKDIADKRLVVPAGRQTEVELILSDGSLYPERGRVNFASLAFTQATGSLRVRAEFANPGRMILPGQFVRVHLRGITRVGALLVPQRSVQQNISGPFVWVVTAGDTAVARPVVATAWEDDRWLIEEGLAAGDRVVVDGVQRVAGNQPVKATPWAPAADPAVHDSSPTEAR